MHLLSFRNSALVLAVPGLLVHCDTYACFCEAVVFQIRLSSTEADQMRKRTVRQTVDGHHQAVKVDLILLLPVVAAGTNLGAVCRP